MQSQLIDRKLSILYDKYKDRDIVVTAQKDVEDIRRKALYVGAATTGAGFFLNEVVRITQRSPLLRLKAHNIALWIAAPTLFSKYYYENHIHERIDKLWQIHVNRENQGLGGTYQPSNLYDDKMQDYSKKITQGPQVSLQAIITGAEMEQVLNNPFVRFHKSIAKYPDFHDDIDDISMLEYDNFERFKQYEPKDGTTVGETPLFPLEDNDTKFSFYDIQGESIYTNPPDSNAPAIDHGLDEEHIWAFKKSVYNQNVIINQYSRNLWEAGNLTHQPWWAQKLLTPSFYKEEKEQKMYFQWNLRLGLERIKMRQALQEVRGDKQQAKQFEDEIRDYIAFTEDQQIKYDMGEIFVTDHTPKEKKVFTLNSNEDDQLFKYHQSLQEYNDTPTQAYIQESEKQYKRGSLLQKMLDPFLGSRRLDNGALFYEVRDDELPASLQDEDRLRAEFEKLRETEANPIDGIEDSDELKIALLHPLWGLS